MAIEEFRYMIPIHANHQLWSSINPSDATPPGIYSRCEIIGLHNRDGELINEAQVECNINNILWIGAWEYGDGTILTGNTVLSAHIPDSINYPRWVQINDPQPDDHVKVFLMVVGN